MNKLRSYLGQYFYIIEFLRQHYTWRVIFWVLLINLFLWLEIVFNTQQTIVQKFFTFVFVFLMLSSLGWFSAKFVFLTVQRAKKLMLVTALIITPFVIYEILIYNGSNFSDLLIRIWNILTQYGIFCLFIWLSWSGYVFLKQEVQKVRILIEQKLAEVRRIQLFLIDEIKLRPLIVHTGIKVLEYSVLTICFYLLFYFIPEFFSTVIPFLSISLREIFGRILLIIAIIPFQNLLISTLNYLLFPKELERVRVDNNIKRMFLMLVIFFIIWLFLLTSVAQNFSILNPNEFVYIDGKTNIPGFLDLLFYTFAIMTNASYAELKPIGTIAHFLVIGMTASGLLLLVVFVGSALSLRSKNIYRGRRFNR